MQTSALEITEYYLRAIRLGKDGNILKPTSIAEQVLPLGTILNGLIKNEKVFLENLNLLLKKFHSAGSHWVVSLPEAATFTMHRFFPNIPTENLKETIEMNYLNFLPGKSEDIFWGWQEVGLIENKNKEVMLSSIKRENLTVYLNCFAKVGITPIAIEPKSCSIARVFGQTQDTLVINLEKNTENDPWIFTAVVLSDGFPRFAREVSLGDHPMEELLKATRSVINYYLTEKRKASINSLSSILLDGNAANPAISENLKTSFGVEVKFARDLFKLFQNSPFSLALLGAGLRAAAGQREDHSLSLLPVGTQEAYHEKNTLKLLRGITNIVAITAILFLAIFFGAIGLFYWLSSQADVQLASLVKINQSQSDAKITEIRGVLKEMNPKIEIEAKLEDQKKVYSTVLKQILAALPSGVSLSQISLTKEDQPLTMVGISQTRESLVNFRENLAKLSFVDSIQLPSSNINQENLTNFTINLTLKKDALKVKTP